MTRGFGVAVLVAVAAALDAPAVRAEPDAAVAVSIGVFEDGLAGQGEWVWLAPYGRVWRPIGVTVDWRPYLDGEWVWTDEGWYWESEEPWAWATYHYGRWLLDPNLGWIWIPGYEWGPAWVAWRWGDGWVGWAPLVPGATIVWIEHYPADVRWWVYVPTVRFVGWNARGYAAPPTRVRVIHDGTRPAPPPRAVPAPVPGRRIRPDAAPPFGGPPRHLVERDLGRAVPRTPIVSVPAPREARDRPESGVVHAWRAPPAPRPAVGPVPAAGGARSAPAAPKTWSPAPRGDRKAAPAPKPRGRDGDDR